MQHVTKKPKDEVDYGRGMGDTRCRNCSHFHPNARICDKVRGPIDPRDWCKLFKRR